jgi:hypothetical protein
LFSFFNITVHWYGIFSIGIPPHWFGVCRHSCL